jgi:hypothetical protein
MRGRIALLLAVATVGACVRAAPPETALRTRYVVIGDTLLEHLSASNRFATLGGTPSVADAMPDTAFCSTYFALADGTYCYRAHANEPFQTRRLDAFVGSTGALADSLLRTALRAEYPPLRPLLFAEDVVVGRDVACASFMVNQVLRTLDGATFYDFFDAPAGIRRSGVGCVVSGRAYAFIDSFPELARLSLWDVVRGGRRPLLLFVRYGDENGQLQLFEGVEGRLILVRSIDLWSL